ncbi:MAG TPA: hypothetical protein VHR55_01455 [Candidatus Limnocylindria bacterium]|nr:hypothetical protein [Candidatus Limnocylindria bacterium]
MIARIGASRRVVTNAAARCGERNAREGLGALRLRAVASTHTHEAHADAPLTLIGSRCSRQTTRQKRFL